MKKQVAFKLVTGLLLSLAIAGMAISCGQKKVETAVKSAMVVVFVTGDARVVKAGAGDGVNAQVGQIVKENDQIKTTRGTVDLQTRNGSAIRIREFTTISINKLAGPDGGDTRLSMQNGSLMATVKKETSKEDFTVVTPTAIAGVRGTTFSVEVEEGAKPRVKVLEGKVAMAPRIAALENYSSDEIQENETLNKLAQIQEKHEVVLEAETEGVLNSEVEDKVAELNTAIEKARQSNQDVAEAVNENAEVKSLVETVSNAEETPAVETRESKLTQQEKIEKDTLVAVAPELVEKVIEHNENPQANPAQGAQVLEELKSQRDKSEEKVLAKIEEEASSKKLKTEKEIKEYYNKLELITLKNGEKISGAVIAQTGDQMVIHTPQGVRRVNKSEVEEQSFAD